MQLLVSVSFDGVHVIIEWQLRVVHALANCVQVHGDEYMQSHTRLKKIKLFDWHSSAGTIYTTLMRFN